MKLYKYQEKAKEFIIENKNAGCFYEPGLGKTVITLSAVNDLLYDYFEISKVLVIAPLRVARDTWSNECEKWEHLNLIKISKVLGTEKKRVEALNKKANVYVINRENIVWLVKHLKGKFPFDMVVIDELSSFKSWRSNRFKVLKKLRPKIDRIVGLTGTPSPNGLMDLWSQVYLLDEGLRLGKTIGFYQEAYFTPDKRSQHVIFSYKPKEEAEEKIYKKIGDICVSMKAKDHLDLPGRIDNIVEVELSKKEKALYKKLEKEMLLPFSGGDVVAVNAATLSFKLLQMANGAVYDENKAIRKIHDRKLEALEDIIESANGKPVLLFYSFKHDKQRIKEKFKVARELETSQDMKDWNNGKIPLAVTHPAATGHGLNLQFGGNIIIWFGLTWSLEFYEQANARLLRQGQKKTVVIYHILTKGSMDQQVMKSLKNKEDGQKSLMEAVKARIDIYE